MYFEDNTSRKSCSLLNMFNQRLECHDAVSEEKLKNKLKQSMLKYLKCDVTCFDYSLFESDITSERQ